MPSRHDTGRHRRPTRSRPSIFGGRKNRRLREPSWREDEKTPVPKRKKRSSRKETSAEGTPGVPRWARAELVQVRAILLGVTALLLKVTLLAGMVLGAVAAGYLGYQQFMTSDHFTVKLLRVDGARRADPAQVQKLARGAMGHHIFTLELAQVRKDVEKHPWVRSAKIRRELPATLVAELEEEEPKALLLMGHLYLVNKEGHVFKRADTSETESLPVITGIRRLDYMNAPELSTPRLKRALSALELYREEKRPPLSEINVSAKGAVTLYMRRGGAALRFGRVVDGDRLSKLDSVLAALGPKAKRVRVVYLDNEARMDRVTVRMNGF